MFHVQLIQKKISKNKSSRQNTQPVGQKIKNKDCQIRNLAPLISDPKKLSNLQFKDIELD